MRKVTELRESNFFHYSCGPLYVVVFWKGCVSMIVFMIRKVYLKRDEKYTFMFCLVSLKISIKTL